MKGTEKVIETLNGLLREELTAISQYMVHAEMYEDWGYEKLGEAEEHRAIEEMKHAETLIERILFLEGARSSASSMPFISARLWMKCSKMTSSWRLMPLECTTKRSNWWFLKR